MSNPTSEENLRRRGYHALHSSYGKVFHVEKRWKLIREMGSGAYGVVISALDEISGETVAVKQVSRVFDKVQLAKRALREITLLRHFSNHENITGMIDLDAISPDADEIYIFMEPMEADLHQIIKSGQQLTNEHVQYFLYQILRGMKYIHSASVVHRDLKPGNLLVNADCELKICDFGLARGFEHSPDGNQTQLTEYVATRWYRAPELMLAFRQYNTGIDVWSIGCIFAELLMAKPLFKGKDYVDQLNKILDVLGTPDDEVIRRIGSDRAQAYIRSLPFKKTVRFQKLFPNADPQAIELLTQMLTFDPAARMTVTQALEHPWLSSYHDIDDEPSCPAKFARWQEVEELETIEQFRGAIWKEIQDYRREVRTFPFELPEEQERTLSRDRRDHSLAVSETVEKAFPSIPEQPESTIPETDVFTVSETAHPPGTMTPTDPVLAYSRRSSFFGPRRRDSYTGSPYVTKQTLPPSREEPASVEDPAAGAMAPGVVGSNSVAFPSESYVVPARSRTVSQAVGMGTFPRRMLRTLSTVSIHESVDGLPADLANLAKYIKERDVTDADAPASEVPRDFDPVDDNGDTGDGERGDGGDHHKFHVP
ncbi:Pkinase-domain-containing protein [Heliocybe sulcata]|uniref:mitogen-activated protein kinase n=1 Tax=Heliocybe sulcata TaxID=5364 RepID=A0A5C3N379_9AGAM|nr:Pkinase-domain-containing protein [Heliocybe sulcata]